MAPIRALAIPLLALAALAAGCDRGSNGHDTDTVQASDSRVRPAATPSASTPLPVSPSGATNASTAAQGLDLTNSTRATGNSNVYQPPSAGNPAAGGAAGTTAGKATATAGPGAASSNGQTTSSQSLGTSPPPDDGTLPRGTTGSTNTLGAGRR